MKKDKESLVDSDEFDLGLQQLYENHISQDLPLASTAPHSKSAKEPHVLLSRVSTEHYEVSGEFARGGLGRILKATDKRLDRVVAIKELLQDQREARARFLREAKITARLQHPSIVPVYEAGCWPTGEPFYAMKLVSGKPLHEIIQSQKSLDDRLALLPNILAAAEAIAYAHNHQVIHRDLKPHNILIGEFGETIVIDWGLAKETGSGSDAREENPYREPENGLSGSAQLTSAGAILGTPAYMPLEQAQGKEVDERADVYSLGAILYHLLSGRAPYHAKTSAQILRNVLQSEPPALESLQEGIPKDLLDLVQKAMARDLTHRYAHAKALADDLKKFLSGQLISAHQYSNSEKLLRFIRQHKTSVLTAGLALLFIIAVSIFSFRQVVSAKNDALQKQAFAEKKQADEARAKQEATTRADSLLLEQARACAEQEPERALYLLSTLSESFNQWSTARAIAATANAYPKPRFLRGHQQEIVHTALSRDGKRIASVSIDGELRLWNLSTDESRSIQLNVTPESSSNFRSHLQLSPDETKLLLATKQKTILILDFHTGSILHTLSGHRAPINQIKFSPDSQWVASSSIIPTELYLWNLKTGASYPLPLSEEPRLLDLSFSFDSHWLATTYQDGTIQVWETSCTLSNTCSTPRSIQRAADGAQGPSFSPDHKKLAVTIHDASVFVIDLESNQTTILKNERKSAELLSLFSPSGAKLATFSNIGESSHSIRLWDLNTQRAQALFTGNTTIELAFLSGEDKLLTLGVEENQERYHLQLWSLSQEKAVSLLQSKHPPEWRLSEDESTVFVAASFGKNLRVWELPLVEQNILSYPSNKSAVLPMQLLFSPDGQRLALTTYADDEATRGLTWLWDLSTRKARAFPLDVNFGVGLTQSRHMQFSLDGALLAVASIDAKIYLLDTNQEEGAAVQFLSGHKAPTEVLVFSADGKTLASGSEDGEVILWDVQQRKSLRVFTENKHRIIDLVFSPDGKTLAASTREGEILLWDLKTKQLSYLQGHTLPAIGLTFSHDSQSLFSCGTDHTIQRWSLQTKEHNSIFAPGQCNWLVLSPDGETLAFSGAFPSVQLWDWSTQKQQSLRGHITTTTEISFSGKGDTLLSASQDATVRLWDLSTNESRIIGRHRDRVFLAKFSPDEKLIASVSLDGEVRLWEDNLPRGATELRAWLNKNAPTQEDLSE